MNWWFILIPLFSAFTGWLVIKLIITSLFNPILPKKILGITLQGIFPKKQQAIVKGIAQWAAGLVSFKSIEEKITDVENIEKIMPFIEEHIDNFLRKKISEEMPMISMFIGEKTIIQLKEVFTKELKELFPLVMKNYIGNLEKNINIEQLIEEKLSSISSEDIRQLFHSSLKKELALLTSISTLIGLIVGIIEVAILLYVCR